MRSGVDSTTGDAAGEWIRATRTMTFALPKTGLVSEKTGELSLADIGIPEAVYRKMELQYSSPFDHRLMWRWLTISKVLLEEGEK
jgi:NAD(P)H-hydrate epimerase